MDAKIEDFKSLVPIIPKIEIKAPLIAATVVAMIPSQEEPMNTHYPQLQPLPLATKTCTQCNSYVSIENPSHDISNIYLSWKCDLCTSLNELIGDFDMSAQPDFNESYLNFKVDVGLDSMFQTNDILIETISAPACSHTEQQPILTNEHSPIFQGKEPSELDTFLIRRGSHEHQHSVNDCGISSKTPPNHNNASQTNMYSEDTDSKKHTSTQRPKTGQNLYLVQSNHDCENLSMCFKENDPQVTDNLCNPIEIPLVKSASERFDEFLEMTLFHPDIYKPSPYSYHTGLFDTPSLKVDSKVVSEEFLIPIEVSDQGHQEETRPVQTDTGSCCILPEVIVSFEDSISLTEETVSESAFASSDSSMEECPMMLSKSDNVSKLCKSNILA